MDEQQLKVLADALHREYRWLHALATYKKEETGKLDLTILVRASGVLQAAFDVMDEIHWLHNREELARLRALYS